MMIAGLEKHTELQGYINKIERRKSERDSDDIKLILRKCTEYIVDQYLKEYPLCVGENLFSSIVNLEEVLSIETANLLHSLRKAGNAGGAHRTEGGKDDFDEVMGLYNDLLNYLPDFLNKFPVPSTKATPKFKESIGLGFEIDFDKIEPLELHPNWRNCIGYQDMLKFKAMPEFDEALSQIFVNDGEELHPWLWAIMLIDELHLVFKKNGKEYLDIKKLVKDYYDRLSGLLGSKAEWETKDWYSRKWEDLNIGYFTESCYIPAIIQDYFPGGTAYFRPGKGFVWGSYWKNRTNVELDALVNGQTALIKQAVKDDVYWYTVGKAQEEERKREAEAYQRVQNKKREEAKEAARREQEKKDYEERVRKSIERRNEERKQLVKKGIKGISIVYAAVIGLALLIFALNFLGQEKFGSKSVDIPLPEITGSSTNIQPASTNANLQVIYSYDATNNMIIIDYNYMNYTDWFSQMANYQIDLSSVKFTSDDSFTYKTKPTEDSKVSAAITAITITFDTTNNKILIKNIFKDTDEADLNEVLNVEIELT